MEPRTTGSRDASHDDAMRFLFELRQLRAQAGLAPAELAARAHYPHHVIMAAEAGPSLPDLPVLSAYLRGCGAGLADWEERWRSLTGSPAAGLCLPTRPAGCSGLASAGARISAEVPEVNADDQRRIMAAISRAEAAMAAATIPAQPVSVPQAATSASAVDLAGTDDALVPSTTPGSAEATEAVDAPGLGEESPPAVSASPPSASGFSPGAPSTPITASTPASPPLAQFPRPARSRRSALPQRAAIAAAVAVLMCVIAAILLVLR